MKLREALDLNLFLRQVPMAVMPVDIAFDLDGNQEIARKLGALYDDRKRPIAEKFALRDDGGIVRNSDGAVVIDETRRAEYEAELNAILDEEIDDGKFVQVSLSRLNEATNLPYAVVQALRPVLTDDRPKEQAKEQ